MIKHPLSMLTHIMLGRAIMALLHLTRAALKESPDPRCRDAILRFQAEADRFRSKMDGILFGSNKASSEQRFSLLTRVYYGSAAPLDAQEIGSLMNGASPPGVASSSVRLLGPCQSKMPATETFEFISRDLLALASMVSNAANENRRSLTGKGYDFGASQ